MPVYDFSCKCGNKLENEFASMTDKNRDCSKCGRKMTRDIGNPRINMGPVPTGGYYDETFGEHVETKTQWKRLCRKHNVTPKGDTPKLEG